jgi:antitoxin component HigA of HigAB toxin-antitoxin module
MKTKNFKTYLEKRVNTAEINAIEKAAQIEFDIYHSLQNDVSKAIQHYMSEHDLGFNDLVRQLGKSPTQLSKIIKNEANLTLATIAKLYAFMGIQAHIVAK